jgi:hypothetical protein
MKTPPENLVQVVFSFNGGMELSVHHVLIDFINDIISVVNA